MLTAKICIRIFIKQYSYVLMLFHLHIYEPIIVITKKVYLYRSESGTILPAVFLYRSEQWIICRLHF